MIIGISRTTAARADRTISISLLKKCLYILQTAVSRSFLLLLGLILALGRFCVAGLDGTVPGQLLSGVL